QRGWGGYRWQRPVRTQRCSQVDCHIRCREKAVGRSDGRNTTVCLHVWAALAGRRKGRPLCLYVARYLRLVRPARAQRRGTYLVPFPFLMDAAVMGAFVSWRRPLSASPTDSGGTSSRFASAQAVLVASSDELACMSPGFVRSLSSQFHVDALAARLCAVLLTDQSVAIFALAEHVGSDQADELARQIAALGHTLADPPRYILTAPLLLAIARNQITAQSL